METKICKCCRKTRSMAEFSVRSDTRDGYENRCKPCKASQALAQYHANKGKPRVKPPEPASWPVPAEADLVTQLLNLHNRRSYGAIPGGLLRAVV